MFRETHGCSLHSGILAPSSREGLGVAGRRGVRPGGPQPYSLPPLKSCREAVRWVAALPQLGTAPPSGAAHQRMCPLQSAWDLWIPLDLCHRQGLPRELTAG